MSKIESFRERFNKLAECPECPECKVDPVAPMEETAENYKKLLMEVQAASAGWGEANENLSQSFFDQVNALEAEIKECCNTPCCNNESCKKDGCGCK